MIKTSAHDGTTSTRTKSTKSTKRTTEAISTQDGGWRGCCQGCRYRGPRRGTIAQALKDSHQHQHPTR